jgi:hypothetical protein
MMGVYHLFNRLAGFLPFLLKIISYFIFGVIFAFFFYKGLVIINYGVLYIYEFVFLVLGYLVYQKYYAYFELLYLERVIFVIKKIIHPFVFFLKKINDIMKKRVRRVKEKWRKKEQDTEIS